MIIRNALPSLGTQPFSNIRFVIGTGKTKHGGDIHFSDLHDSLQEIRAQLAKLFGGYTETTGRGGWYDEARGVLVEETNVIFDVAIPTEIAFYSARYDQEIAKAQDVVDLAKRILQQECALVQFSYGQSAIV